MIEGVTEASAMGAMQFRVHGLLDRSLTALRRLGEVITRMESRIPRGPPDYEHPGTYIDYRGTGPTAPEPSWQNRTLSIVGTLLVAGILAIFAVLWAMNENIRDLRGDNRLLVQRLDQQDEHLKATDRDVAEIKQEIWPHKH